MTYEVLAEQLDYYRRRFGDYDVTAYGDDVDRFVRHRAAGRGDAAGRESAGDRVRDWLAD